MRLPGAGTDDVVELAPITGRIERALYSPDTTDTVARRVTSALALAVMSVGGRDVDETHARAMSSGQRRWLLRAVLVAAGLRSEWLTRACGSCGAPFDVLVEHDRLLDAPVAHDHPVRTVTSAAGRMHVRVPTGQDEEAIATADDPGAALLARCVAPADGSGGLLDVTRLDAATTQAVDEAIEDLGPRVVVELATRCPACGVDEVLSVDPYDVVGRGDDALVADVHRLARAYHWSEEDVLALPVTRRRRYLAHVDRDRGFVA
jgi:hypothetical protein